MVRSLLERHRAREALLAAPDFLPHIPLLETEINLLVPSVPYSVSTNPGTVYSPGSESEGRRLNISMAKIGGRGDYRIAAGRPRGVHRADLRGDRTVDR